MPWNSRKLIFGEIKKTAKETNSSPVRPEESQGIVETEKYMKELFQGERGA